MQVKTLGEDGGATDMTRKSLTVRKDVKKAGKRSKIVIKPVKAKQTKDRRVAKPAQHVASLNSDQANFKRELKIRKALYEIADAASAVEDMQLFYKKLHKIVGKLMYAENLIIALYDSQNDLITWPYYIDSVDFEPPKPSGLSEHQGVTGYVLRNGKTLSHADGSCQAAMKRGEFKQVGPESDQGIAVPLKIKTKTIGVILIQSYIKSIGYQLEDVKVLEFVAQHISTALTRARAIEETRQRNAELAFINNVQGALASKLDMQSIYDLVGDKIREIFDAQAVLIATFDHLVELTHIPYNLEKGQRFHAEPKIGRASCRERV